MGDRTLTIVLNGDVPLKKFEITIRSFYDIVYGLTDELAPNAGVEWMVVALEAGSATATVEAISDDSRVVSRIVDAYTEVGRALRDRAPIHYSDRVKKAARDVTRVLNDHITSLRFETSIEDIYISAQYSEDARPTYSYAIGSIKGTVEALSRRYGVRFTLYDAIFDRPINCYLESGHEDEVRDYWGKKVFVSGLVTRDSDTGKPIAIRKVAQIRPAQSSTPGSYRNARGAIRLDQGETSDGIIRKIRDAE